MKRGLVANDYYRGLYHGCATNDSSDKKGARMSWWGGHPDQEFPTVSGRAARTGSIYKGGKFHLAPLLPAP